MPTYGLVGQLNMLTRPLPKVQEDLTVELHIDTNVGPAIYPRVAIIANSFPESESRDCFEVHFDSKGKQLEANIRHSLSLVVPKLSHVK